MPYRIPQNIPLRMPLCEWHFGGKGLLVSDRPSYPRRMMLNRSDWAWRPGRRRYGRRLGDFCAISANCLLSTTLSLMALV